MRICAGTACHASGRPAVDCRLPRPARRAGARRQGARRRDRLPRLLRAGAHRRRQPQGCSTRGCGQRRRRHHRRQHRRRRHLREAPLQGSRAPASRCPTSATSPSTPVSAALVLGAERQDRPVLDRRLPAQGGYRGPGQVLAADDPDGRHRHGARLPACAAAAAPASRPARSGATAGQPGQLQVRHLQRRRGRPRRVHGPLRARGQPARRDGGHDDRRAIALGARPRLRLRPRRVSAGRAAPRSAPSPRRANAACSATTSSASGFDFDIDRQRRAPAPSSAARRPR